jgi:glycolate oxidase FAD binding subunit
VSVSVRTIGSALAEVTGSAAVSEGAEAARIGRVDGIVPRWVVAPTTSEQVARVLALAHGEGLVVVPRGSGSALSRGAPLERADMVLDTRNLARVVDYNPDDLTVSVEAGLTAGGLAERLAERRQWLPVDAPDAPGRTLGGLTATNALGPLRVRYGTLRDLLLGVRFVQADGVITWGGARVVKSVTGYDVPKLMVGALGTLGVLTELTLRLHPRPEFEETWLATFPSAGAAQTFVGLVIDSSLQPNRIEFLNAPALSACAMPVAPAAVAVSIGSVEAAVREQGADLVTLAQRAGGTLRAPTAAFWATYDRALTRGPGEPADAVVLQVGTLPSRLAETTEAIAPGLAPIVTGCAALGSLHVVLDAVGTDGAVTAIARLRDSIAGFGGHVVVLAAPRAVRAAVDPWGPVAPAALAVMQRLKREFDPRRVLNPGRFVGGI